MTPARSILLSCALPACHKRMGARDPHDAFRPRRFCCERCRWRYFYAQWRKLGHELGVVAPRWACPRWVHCAVCERGVR